jgi:kynurenine formamidase
MLIDLSHPIEDGMAIYPGLPRPVVGAFLDHDASQERYEGKAEFHLGTVAFAGATGTYLDSPFHRHRDAADIAALPLERLAGLPGVTLDHDGGPAAIGALERLPGVNGHAVLLRTGWAERWGSDAYWEQGPFLGGDLLDALVAATPALVGIDTGNIDDMSDLTRPAHTRLLAADICIVENLADLTPLPASGFRFTAVPPAVVGGSNFPVRAFAEIG